MPLSAAYRAAISPAQRILDTAFAFRESRVLLAAVELGVFTELGKGPRSCRQLCRALALNEAAASALLDALVTLGFLERDGSGARAIYLHTRAGASLLDGASTDSLDGTLRHAARWYRVWDGLPLLLRASPRTARRDLARKSLRKVLAQFDVGRDDVVLDLSRPAGLCRSVLPARRRCGVLVRGTGSRALPAADLVILASPTPREHWRDPRDLLIRIRRALRVGGALIVVEPMTDLPAESFTNPAIVALGKRLTRAPDRGASAAEIQRACRAAGFVHSEVQPLIWPLAAIVACTEATRIRRGPAESIAAGS